MVTQSQIPPTQDTMWLILCAEEWINGGTYFNDFIEVNPPASILLHVPVVYLKDYFFSVPVYTIAFYYLATLIFFSILLCFLLKRSFEKHENEVLFSFISIFVFLLILMLPRVHFGQKDILLFVAMIPYILSHIMVTFRLKIHKPLEWGCCLWASFFIVLKPHFYIVVLGLSLVRMFVKRDVFQIIRDPTNYIMGFVAVIYVIFSYLFFPEFFTFIFMDVVNIYIDGSFKHFDFFEEKVREFAVALFLLSVVIFFIKRKIVRTAAAFTFFLYILFFLGFAFQNKGFPYQYVPAQILLYTVVFIIIFGFVQHFYKEIFLKTISYAFLFICLFFCLVRNFNLEHNISSYEQSDRVSYFDENVKAGEYYSILQFGMANTLPSYYYTQGNWGSRFPSLWFIKDLVKGKKQVFFTKDDGGFNKLSSKYQDVIIKDLEIKKPKIVLIPTKSKFFEFMSDNEAFNDIWKNYKYKERKNFLVAKEIHNRSYMVSYDVYCLNC